MELGELVGCFRLDAVIGHGGMGVVYRATDIEIGREVAVKVCWPDIDQALLVREARALAGFRHPGLIYPLYTGVHDGTRYLAMELLRGTSLSHVLRNASGARLAIADAAELVARIADVLTTLHEAGVAHRDIKPGNIMLVPPDRIVLLDFGLADLERFAGDHYRAASPYYVSPEMILDEVNVGQAHCSDLYALGVVAYLALTGRVPFDGDDASYVYTAHVEAAIPDPRNARPEISSGLALLVMSMLAKQPGERPAAELIAHQLRSIELTGGVTRPLRVLVADDDRAMWEILGYVLEDHGFELVFVEDGRAALNAIDRQLFDIVITDKNMPYLDGLELAHVIQRRKTGTDVILITGYSSEAARRDAAAAGVRSFVEKPFDIDTIARVIDEVAGDRLAQRNGLASP
jgi:CheY-like chemotaxis protein